MTREFRYLFGSRRWTARLARAALLSNLLAISLLLCLARATDGIRYLADFPLAWRLGLVLGPPLLAIILFRKILPRPLVLLLFASFLIFAEIAGLRFDETEINPWNPVDDKLQPWIERNLGYADVADFAELWEKPSPRPEEIRPLVSRFGFGSPYERWALPWVTKDANLATLHSLVEAMGTRAHSPLSDAARMISQRLSPPEHRELARSFPDGFLLGTEISPPCFWDESTQSRIWRTSKDRDRIASGANPFTVPKIFDELQADLLGSDENQIAGQRVFNSLAEVQRLFNSLAKVRRGQKYRLFLMQHHPGVRHLPSYVSYNYQFVGPLGVNYPQLSEAQRLQLPQHTRMEQEIRYFGAGRLLPRIRAEPQTSTLDCDDLTQLVGPAEYLGLASRAVSNGDDAWRWLNIGHHLASLRGKTLAAIQDLQPSVEEDSYYLFEQQLNATDGLLCLRLFAANDQDASDALAVLGGTVSRAESHARRKQHYLKDPSSKASRFLDVALRMKMGLEKSRRLEDMGTIRCGLRKREAVYLTLLFIVTGVICALLPGQSTPQEDTEDERR
ncbi:MAG: hypothetical protein ACI8W8_001610 [Rhodothermales bacterium]|jgi:hypothetical protein